MIRSFIAAIALLCALAFAPSAGAATTIGSSLAVSTGGPGIFCASTCTVVQAAIPGQTTAAPADGVIVRWRIKTSGAGGPFQLRVAKPFNGNSRVGAGWSAAQNTTAAGISEFATRMPIRTGDNIGLDFNSSNTAVFMPSVGTVGALSLYFAPLLPDSVETSPNIANTNTEMLYNADIEPDADRDGFGDESQDRCVGVFGAADGCDRTAPKLEVGFASSQKVGSLKITALVNEVATVTARAKVSYRSGKKTVTVSGKQSKLAYSTLGLNKTMRLSFSKKQRTKLRALIKRGRKLSAKVTVTAVDASGNPSTLTPKIKLRS